ncbi:CbtB-domain containing protein [Chelatococcus sambhunathii]|uniref:CbtB-domain containing protein n=1 Tax=Chelatococcus sambhunathii TaxID=363953 RepID=A0ABU1DK66_9HYPH|nr:CbtB domain-containing protein [Chelatococcus sambhunathii]MDR4308466.1 CbtB-domain containing protein [Chelatococcus sambhunathii]
MSNLTAARTETAAALQARALPIVSAFLLGVFVVAAAGFVSIPAVHNAAHDQRHAIGFPCH